MRKILLFFALAAGHIVPCHAQETTITEPISTKKIDHFVGVQMNGLIRQVLNFSNTTPVAPLNPYLFTYSINSRGQGWGARVGLGYQYSATWANDGITETETKINDINARIGLERKFELSDKWSAGFGADWLYNNSDDYTKATLRSTDTIITITKSKLPSIGGGLMGWLRYKVSKHVLIGTESSFTFTNGIETREVITTKKERSLSPPFTFSTVTTITKSKPTHADMSFKLPVVFYLVISM